MKKRNKNGFTLIEIIAAVTILGIVSAIGIVSVNSIIQKGKAEHYKTTEKNIRLTAESYAQTNRSYLPKNIGEMRKITLRTLVEDNYIEEVKDYYDNTCDLDESYVQIFKYSKTGYSYLTYLNCEDYTNAETLKEMKPEIEIEMTEDSDNVSKTEAIIGIKDDNKLLSYSITIYRYDEQVYTTGNLEASYAKEIDKTIDISKYTPGKIKVVVKATNIYGQTTTLTKTVEYADKQGPTCEIAPEDETRTDAEWIKTQRTITVGCNDGEEGSGCTRETYTKTFKSDAKYDYITIEDKAGNKTKCRVAVYIDKTAPSCKITPSGTKGDNGWYKTNNVTMKVDTYTGKNLTDVSTQSPISGYDLTTSTTATYAGTTKTKTQTNTAGTVWYGYVKDKAGNVAKCQSDTIKVDTNAPTCSIASSGTAGENGWYKSNATITITTNDVGPSTLAAYDLTTSKTATYAGTTKSKTQTDTNNTIWYGYVKDKAGNIGSCNNGTNTGNIATSPIKVDTKAPTCTVKTAGTKGTNDWYKTNATVTLTTNDGGGSPINGYNLTTSTSPSYNGSTKTQTQTNTTGTTWYGYVKDQAGNVSSCNTGSFKVDTTPPTCSIAKSGTSGTNGWYKSNVSLTLTTTESGGSNLAGYGFTTSSSPSYSSSSKTATQSDTKGITWYGYVKDNAGHVGSCNTGSFKVDTVAPSKPSLTISGSGTLTVKMTSSDSTSGLNSFQYRGINSSSAFSTYSPTGTSPITITTSSPVEIRAVDNAGNASGVAYTRHCNTSGGTLTYDNSKGWICVKDKIQVDSTCTETYWDTCSKWVSKTCYDEDCYTCTGQCSKNSWCGTSGGQWCWYCATGWNGPGYYRTDYYDCEDTCCDTYSYDCGYTSYYDCEKTRNYSCKKDACPSGFSWYVSGSTCYKTAD